MRRPTVAKSSFTTSIAQFFGAGTDQSVRVPLTLPTTPGHAFVVQAVGVLSSGAAVASPGLVFRF